MYNLTDEQNAYINFNEHIDTKLIATAGSAKTFTVIQKAKHIIENGILSTNQLLILTYSRLTQNDFLNKTKKYRATCIDEHHIKTIDSFAKSIIDTNNQIDVSILSYVFMIYLKNTSPEIIQTNNKLKNIKSIYVDEAQDLNETQYTILCLLKEKNNCIINLIGDPNQNIFQFRGSSDKYLTNFSAKTFYLTRNFRSYQEIVDFSQFLRPDKNIHISCNLGPNNRLPVIVHYQNEHDLEINIVGLLKKLSINTDLSDFAILSPTRGRMRPYGYSHGLCFITNVLYKNGIKFQQFYDEINEETSNIPYIPKQGYVNILTYMGSKGLEWKYTILIDAETCLINKRYFTHEKHNHDRYLLYVACSRAIKNIFIFSRCIFNIVQKEYIFNLNQWFSTIPNRNYIMNEEINGKNKFKFSDIVEKNIISSEKKITKILDNCPENKLYELSALCDYGMENNKSIKEIINIYESKIEQIDNFMSKFIKELFFAYYNILNNNDRKKYIEIENILNTYSLEHTIPNYYYKFFILSNLDQLKEAYQNYLYCDNKTIIRKYLLYIIRYIYSLETQHYFHTKNNDQYFIDLSTEYTDLFDKIYIFLQKKKILINKINVPIPINKYNLIGEIDFIDNDDNIYDIKCTRDITLKHIIQQVIYTILYHQLYDSDKQTHHLTLHFINFMTGTITKIKLNLSKKQITDILSIFTEKIYPTINLPTET